MHTIFSNAFLRVIGALSVAVVSTSMIAGCVTDNFSVLPTSISQNAIQIDLPPAPLARPAIGDKYYYNNGRTERVVAINKDNIEWVTNKKRRMITSIDPTIPAIFKESATKTFHKNTNAAAGEMWPLMTGNTSRYSTRGTTNHLASGNKSQYTQYWQCGVEGAQKVQVQMGAFDAYRIECARYSSRAKFLQRSTWLYAPEIGHSVLTQQYYKRSQNTRTQTLTAIRPSLKDFDKKTRRAIRAAFQGALENKSNGQTTTWKGANGVLTAITPTGTFKSESGTFCRSYRQTLQAKGVSRVYPGIACRVGKLNWRTPRRI